MRLRRHGTARPGILPPLPTGDGNREQRAFVRALRALRTERPVRRQLAALGVAASAVFAYVAVRNVDIDLFSEGLRSSNYWWLVPSVVALAIGVYLRALRWTLLFDRGSRPPVGVALRALLISYLFNNILPVRAGEIVRVVVLHREVRTSRAEIVGTAVAERIYDILTLLILLFAFAPLLPEVTWLRQAALLALVVATGTGTLIALGRTTATRLLVRAARPLTRFPRLSRDRVDSAAANLVQGLDGLRRPGVAALVFAVTALGYAAIALSFWLALIGFDFGVDYRAGMLVLVATNLAMILPSGPAAVGVFEAATVVALTAFGVEESAALSYAVVLHAVNFFPYVVVGALLLQRHAAVVARREQLAAAGGGRV